MHTKASKDTINLSKMKEASSSSPNPSLPIFLHEILLITRPHHTPHPQEDLPSVQVVGFVLVFICSDTEKELLPKAPASAPGHAM